MKPIAYAIVSPDGGVKQVFGELSKAAVAGAIGVGTPQGRGGPDDMSIAILTNPNDDHSPLNEVMARLGIAGIRGTVVVTGMPDENNEPTSIDVHDEEALRKIAAG